MIEESLGDFRKRYKGTYVFLHFNEKDHLVRYDHDNEEDFCFYSPIYGDILVDEDTARNQLSIRFPNTGLYNLRGTVHEFSRLPARQWKRAPCMENTNFHPLLNNINCRETKIALADDIPENLFYPIFPDNIDQALGKLKLAIALSHDFAISQSTTGKHNEFLFWFRSQPIGFLYPETRSIKVMYRPLLQEVIDFLKKKEYTWTLHPRT